MMNTGAQLNKEKIAVIRGRRTLKTTNKIFLLNILNMKQIQNHHLEDLVSNEILS